ncbi:hypothetical protein BC830DRAFT_1085691 [Chytriomyces sp. MP71]|nr:hypothetical protein BC830DRAFT_1085691 [Chytriomyces sp. MP71]
MSTTKRTIFANKSGTEAIISIKEDGTLDFGDASYIDSSDMTIDQLSQLVKKVRLGDQRDIAKEEGDNSGTTILRDLQFEYRDGSTVMVPVANVVIEYRSTAGTEKTRGSGKGKYVSNYAVKTLSIGIPIDVYTLIMSKLTSGYNGFLHDKTGEKILNGYVWIDGSVSSQVADKHATEAFAEANEHQVTYVSKEGKEFKQTSIGCFRDVLRTLECNLTGVAYINFRVKTVAKNMDAKKYFRLGCTIDSFQVINVTHIKSPDINVKKSVSSYNSKYVVQDELVDVLRAHTEEQYEEDDGLGIQDVDGDGETTVIVMDIKDEDNMQDLYLESQSSDAHTIIDLTGAIENYISKYTIVVVQNPYPSEYLPKAYVSKNETLNVKLDSYTSELLMILLKVCAKASYSHKWTSYTQGQIRMLGPENGFGILIKKFDSINIVQAEKRFTEAMSETGSGVASQQSTRTASKTSYMHDVIDACWKTVLTMNGEWKDTNSRCNLMLDRLEAIDNIDISSLRSQLEELLHAVKNVQKNMLDAAGSFNAINNSAFGKDSPMTGRTGHVAPVAVLVSNSKTGEVTSIKPLKLKAKVVSTTEDTRQIETRAPIPASVTRQQAVAVPKSIDQTMVAEPNENLELNPNSVSGPSVAKQMSKTAPEGILGRLKTLSVNLRKAEEGHRAQAIKNLGKECTQMEIIEEMNRLREATKTTPKTIPAHAVQTKAVTVEERNPQHSRTPSASSTSSRLLVSKSSNQLLRGPADGKSLKKNLLRPKNLN